MNYAFFGTSDKSTPILDALNPILCVTKEDRRVGREQELCETAVKKWAIAHNVDCLCIASARKSKDEIIEKLKEHNIDLVVVADFSFMLPIEIINAVEYGLINIHFSLLPTLRGASPVQNAILLGHPFTGITFQLMEDGMDTGDILDQIVYPLSGKETTASLYEALFEIAGKEIKRVIRDYINGSISPQTQNESQATYCYSHTNPESTLIDKNDAKIDWASPVEHIERMTRAYNPWPIAWTTLGELENNHKLHEEITLNNSTKRDTRVKILEVDLLTNGFKKIQIKQLQVAGKNIMDWKSFVNGYSA